MMGQFRDFTLAVTLATLCLATPSLAVDRGLHADFNGDGHGDLAIGIPYDDPGIRGGGVQVLYGRKGGLSATGSQLWNQNTIGIPDAMESEDLFGEALAAGDFDNDGYDDLAIGVPQEQIGDLWQAGAVHVLYGSSTGLKFNRNQMWTQDSPGMGSAAEQADHFGASLTAADFNDDGYDDLAVGVPGESGTGYEKVWIGAVHVIYGSYGGLDHAFNQIWTQDTPDIQGGAERYDQFGSTLTSGDFDGDGHADLAVGVENEKVGELGVSGAVNVLYGSYHRLMAAGNQIWHRGQPGLWAAAEYDHFGAALATGDFDGDGYGDLAIGAHGTDVVESGAGTVDVLYGTSAGLAIAGHHVLHEQVPGVIGSPAMSDSFGRSLAAGDFNDDGRDDLAVGTPGDWVSGERYAGSVHVFHGAPGGLNGLDGFLGFNDQLWNQASSGVEGAPEHADDFGFALTTGDFDDNGVVDLAIGVLCEAIGSVSCAGAVNVLYAEAVAGITSRGDQVFHQNTSGLASDPQIGEWFGSGLGR